MNEAAAVKTIIFKDHQQDFLEWDIDADGVVVACRPFQREVWCGRRVLNPEVQPGEQVFVTVDELAYLEIDHTMPIKFPVAKVISADTPERKIKNLFNKLVHTSVEDCRISCEHLHNPEDLRAIIDLMDTNYIEDKSRRIAIERRIRKLEKQEENVK